MKYEIQYVRILKELRKTGKLSRNWALKNYITRLSAYIYDLESMGWQFGKRGYLKNEFGKDYVYYVTKQPKNYVKNS